MVPFSSSSFDIFADRDFGKDVQVVEDYGDNDDDVYALHHGFVPSYNPFTCVNVLNELYVLEEMLNSKDKTLHLTVIGTLIEHLQIKSKCIHPGSDKVVPLNTYAIFKIANMTLEEIGRCNDFLKASTSAALTRCIGILTESSYQRDKVLYGQFLAKVSSGYKQAYDQLTKSVPAPQALSASSTLLDERISILRQSHLQAGICVHDDCEEYQRHLVGQYFLNKATACGKLLEEMHADAATGDDSVSAYPMTTQSTPDDNSPKNAFVMVDEDLVREPTLELAATKLNEWVQQSNPPQLKIRAKVMGNGMRLGVETTQALNEGDEYLSLPVSHVMSLTTARKCSLLGPVFAELRETFPRGDPFHELLFHLVFEMFDPRRRRNSHWSAYLATLPTSEEMRNPLFYNSSELDELQNPKLVKELKDSRSDIISKYRTVRSVVLSAFPQIFDVDSVFTLKNYVWAHTVLDSRTIWWNSERHLVPLLDLINCKEGPDPYKIHSTTLDSSQQYAVTKASWDFLAGEQLFENYGQPNHIYFTYHGFVLLDNVHDCVPIQYKAKERSSRVS